MTNIKATVTGADLALEVTGVLTGGMVGVPITFSFDSAWDGLSKTAVFRAGGLSMDAVGVEGETTVPWEVLQKTGCTLYVGVCGTAADGSAVIPTLWAEVGVIRPGADPSGDESADPSLPVWAQVQENAKKAAEQAVQTAKAYTDSVQTVQSGMAGSYHAYNGTVKEYLNPPMAVGVEYPTVRRFLNKPVYTMLVEAYAPDTKGKAQDVKFASNLTHIVTTQVCEVYRADGSRYSDSGVLRVFSRIDKSNNGCVAVELPQDTVGTAYNGVKIHVIMEYTKN